MRKFIFVAVLSIVAPAAHAADLPFLRGSLSEGRTMGRSDWDGFYVGAQAGVGESDMNFTGATRTLAGGLLSGLAMESAGQVSQWPLLGKTSQRGNGWGGFAGYNSQWDDVVVGVELSYLHGKFGGSQTGSMGRSFVDALGYTNGVTYDATAKMSVTDMGTLRVRAGYAVGAFLPYLFGGIALGQADIVRSAHIYGVAVNASAAPGFTNIPFDYSKTEGQYSKLVYGYTAGAGVDINLIGGLFARAEWEYVRFTSSVDTNINTVRAGLGYKF
jgi:opacity protein-like surface antigen